MVITGNFNCFNVSPYIFTPWLYVIRVSGIEIRPANNKAVPGADK
jgi:hypothetical protein